MAAFQPNESPLNTPEGRRSLLCLLIVCAHPDCSQQQLEEARAVLAPWLADLLDVIDPPAPIAPTTTEAFKEWATANLEFTGDRDHDLNNFREAYGQYFPAD